MRPPDHVSRFWSTALLTETRFIVSHFGDGDDNYGGCPGAFDERIVPSAIGYPMFSLMVA
jgi:hypothetical protein